MNEYHYSPCPTCGHQRWVPVDHVDKPNDAAKELLEACKKVRMILQGYKDTIPYAVYSNPEGVFEELEAAIAKAEGK